ncbi:hypothetical protein WG922_06900 [Ramlibacter sp. AN1015]|uniref:hypothetical protein n=1 Tax=Ramlibacter sp. AN1015 TaxID=3133428 RepID=UPI0030C1DAEB
MALAGCERGADTGATSNPNLPGRPGEGNPTTTVAPQPEPRTQVDSPGITERAKAYVPPGITGRGQAEPGIPTEQGVGTTGGLGGSPAGAGDAAATRGSPGGGDGHAPRSQ